MTIGSLKKKKLNPLETIYDYRFASKGNKGGLGFRV